MFFVTIKTVVSSVMNRGVKTLSSFLFRSIFSDTDPCLKTFSLLFSLGVTRISQRNKDKSQQH